MTYRNLKKPWYTYANFWWCAILWCAWVAFFFTPGAKIMSTICVVASTTFYGLLQIDKIKERLNDLEQEQESNNDS